MSASLRVTPEAALTQEINQANALFNAEHPDESFFAYLARHIIAAGWRPPARTVSTVEEIEALPVRTVLYSPSTHDAYDRIEVFGAKLRGLNGAYYGRAWWSDFLPLTVLYEPPAEGVAR